MTSSVTFDELSALNGELLPERTVLSCNFNSCNTSFAAVDSFNGGGHDGWGDHGWGDHDGGDHGDGSNTVNVYNNNGNDYHGGGDHDGGGGYDGDHDGTYGGWDRDGDCGPDGLIGAGYAIAGLGGVNS